MFYQASSFESSLAKQRSVSLILGGTSTLGGVFECKSPRLDPPPPRRGIGGIRQITKKRRFLRRQSKNPFPLFRCILGCFLRYREPLLACFGWFECVLACFGGFLALFSCFWVFWAHLAYTWAVVGEKYIVLWISLLHPLLMSPPFFILQFKYDDST